MPTSKKNQNFKKYSSLCLVNLSFDPMLKVKLDTLSSAAMPAHVVVGRSRNLLGSVENKSTSVCKNPALVEPAGSIVPLLKQMQIKAGDTGEIPVLVSNQGEEVWFGYGDHPVFLSYHWENRDGSNHTYDGSGKRRRHDLLPEHPGRRCVVHPWWAGGERSRYRVASVGGGHWSHGCHNRVAYRSQLGSAW